MLPSDLWDGAEFSVTDPSGRMKEPTPLYSLLTSTGTLRLADKHRHTQTDRYRHTDRHRHREREWVNSGTLGDCMTATRC